MPVPGDVIEYLDGPRDQGGRVVCTIYPRVEMTDAEVKATVLAELARTPAGHAALEAEVTKADADWAKIADADRILADLRAADDGRRIEAAKVDGLLAYLLTASLAGEVDGLTIEKVREVVRADARRASLTEAIASVRPSREFHEAAIAAIRSGRHAVETR